MFEKEPMETLQQLSQGVSELKVLLERLKYYSVNSEWLTKEQLAGVLDEVIKLLDDAADEASIQVDVAMIVKEVEGHTDE